MKVEYWSADKQSWQPSKMDWSLDWVRETNRLLGWEMYREAE